jgi:isopropylmalate/homocitrate/citramalate synthase
MKIDERTVPSSANVLTAPFEARIEQPIELLDTTLREGEQPPGVVFSPDQKLRIAEELDRFGVHWVSVGFPAVSEEERETAKRIVDGGFRFRTAALCRLMESDIDYTVDLGIELVSLFLGGSDTHLHDKLGLSEDDAYRKIAHAVEHSKRRGAVTAFGVEDFSRTPLPRLLKMLRTAVDAGADWLTLPDTLGVLTPASTVHIVRLLRASLERPVMLHFHDDFGLGLANALAGLEAGAEMVHVTVNGVGERAGNTCLEELAVVLAVKYGRDLGLDLSRLDTLCRLVHELSGTEPPAHKAVTGRWAFTHEAGIHVAGVLANPECYQPYPPATVGRHHEIVFGKHSGIKGVERLAAEHGLTVPDEAKAEILGRIKHTAEQRLTTVPEDEILRWVREAAGAGAHSAGTASSS